MASTISTVDAGFRSASTTSHIPSFPPFTSKKFECSPSKHSLPRTGLDAVSDQSRFLAVMEALAYQIQGLSLSGPSSGPATASIGSSVHTATPNGTESISVEASSRHKPSNCRPNIFYKCTQSIRASLKKAALKRGARTKKTGGASPPLSRCPSQASPPPLYFDAPPSYSLPAVSTTGDWNDRNDTPMDDDVPSSSPQPTSPAPIQMEVEVGTPSSDSTLVPNSPRTPWESSMNSELDSAVSEPTDTIMREGAEESHETALAQQTESASKIFIDSISLQRGSSSLDQDIEMINEDESKSFIPLRPTPIPSVQPTEATFASNELEGTSEMNINQGPASTSAPATTIAHQEGGQAQTLPNARLDTAPPSEQPTEVAQNEETSATQPDVALIQSPGSASTSTGTATSIDPLPVATPSPTATSSTTGPSTPALLSTKRPYSGTGSAYPNTRYSPPPTNDPEEVEALAFFANLKNKAAAQPPVKAKSKPAPLPSPSEPTPTKGSAARSLMDDIMAGFRGITKPKSSQQHAPVVAHPPTRPDPAATNSLRSTSVVQDPSPVGAGRQTGPRSAPPHYVGNGSGVSAPSGSMIPTSRAPSAVPMPSKVSGPSGGIPPAPPSEAIPRRTTSEPSTSAPGDGQFGQERAIKGTRRVAKAVIKTGLTWQIVQQRAREAQAASDLDQVNAAAPTPTGSVPSLGRSSTQSSERSEEEPTGKRRCL